jgi:hypothetical protein
MKKLLASIFIILSITAFSYAQTKINPARLLQGQTGGGSMFLRTDNSGNVSFSNNLNGGVVSGAGNGTLSGDLVNKSQLDLLATAPVADERLSSNIARKNTNNSFATGQSITGTLITSSSITNNQGGGEPRGITLSGNPSYNATNTSGVFMNMINYTKYDWYSGSWFVGSYRSSGDQLGDFAINNGTNDVIRFSPNGNVQMLGKISAPDASDDLHLMNRRSSVAIFQPLENQRVSTNNVVSHPWYASTVATGTAPFSIISTTLVNNLNADMVDGLHASAFAQLATDNTFSGRMAIGGSINTSFNLTVTGSGLFSSNLTVNGVLTANTANISGATTNNSNTQIWSVGSANSLQRMDISSLPFEIIGNIAGYSAHFVSSFTADIGGGVMRHIITLDCSNMYMRTFRVNLSQASALGLRVTLTNARAGGMYTINYFNGSSGTNIFYEQAKKQDGATDFGTFNVSGMTTHRFSFDAVGGTGFIQAF